MSDLFLRLSAADRREALGVAATKSGRPVHLLEKDIWVVWTLDVLFGAPFANKLVFKGGTSLSKAYGVIRRFSEDIDVTYDIRAFAPDLVGDAPEALPPTRSQEKRWTREIRVRLSEWVSHQALPLIADALSKQSLPARASAENDKIYVEYEPLTTGSGYVRPTIIVEFGARSTGEPYEIRPVSCDAAYHLAGVIFPTAKPRVMRAERTFWEKATAIHVFCAQGEFRGSERFARHWYDVAKLDEAGFADAAIADRELADAVARHKAMFFAEKDTRGAVIDYPAAVAGALQLVPTGAALTALSSDYARMVEDGLLFDEAETFERVLDRCRSIQKKANSLNR
jgi:hypothetical protein